MIDNSEICTYTNVVGKEAHFMSVLQKNRLLYYFAYAFRTVTLLCASGTLVQTFLSALGFSTDEIYIHATVLRAANVLTIVLFPRFADKKSAISRIALVQIPAALLLFLSIPFCIANDASPVTYILLVIVAAAHSVTTGLHTVCDYKIPYVIFSAKTFGTVLAVSGLISSLLSLAVGSVISYLSTLFPFSLLMLYAFLISGCLLLLSSFLYSRMKPLEKTVCSETSDTASEKVPLLAVFRHPTFLHLIPANLLRGFSAGVVTVLPAMALSAGFNESATALMISVSSLANIAACLLFAVLLKCFRANHLIGICSLPFFVLPFLFKGNTATFLTLYGIFILTYEIINQAVPTALRFSVPANIAGPYNAWRMILHNGGILLATTVAVFIPTQILLISALVCQLISGAFYFFLNIMKKDYIEERTQI